MDIEKRFTVKQVAALWGCSGQHIYRLLSRRELGHIRVGGAIRFRPEDLIDFEKGSICRASSENPTIVLRPAAVASGISSGGTAKSENQNAFLATQEAAAKQKMRSRLSARTC